MEAQVKKTVSLDAVVYPACLCGEPWAKHGACGGYRPSGPTKDYGTIFFQSPDRIATCLFKLELIFKKLRMARLKRVKK